MGLYYYHEGLDSIVEIIGGSPHNVSIRRVSDSVTFACDWENLVPIPTKVAAAAHYAAALEANAAAAGEFHALADREVGSEEGPTAAMRGAVSIMEGLRAQITGLKQERDEARAEHAAALERSDATITELQRRIAEYEDRFECPACLDLGCGDC